ncbi:hypothetical protein [Acinetobacter stercoris]|uniref:Uncharacterized protein n=1 Tax=Acinetobacter stercoris TaxID=2126983 RepID=A0A2U3N214_9GAMM|nr:hypothetical protein [Acinetobacter stercoris]SPL71736.1 hypothetical protein KPC_2914 [Acinetobacter stercoris]
MSILLSPEAKIEQLKALANFIDQGSKNATFVFYSSTKPENTSISADNSALIVSLDLPKPCVKAYQDNQIELYPSESGLVLKTAIPVWARLYNGENKAVADLAVGTDITLSDSKLVLGGTLHLDSIMIKMTE